MIPHTAQGTQIKTKLKSFFYPWALKTKMEMFFLKNVLKFRSYILRIFTTYFIDTQTSNIFIQLKL